MRAQIIISSTDVEKLKQKARKLKKHYGTPHHKALDQVAQGAGFNDWHHVSESAKTFKPTEQAYYFGVIIAMDVKDSEDFHDTSGTFVVDDFALFLCHNDVHERLCESVECDDGVQLRDKYSIEELTEWSRDEVKNYIFYRFTGKNIPERAEDIVEMVRPYSFGSPRLIWLRGALQDSHNDTAIDEDGVTHSRRRILAAMFNQQTLNLSVLQQVFGHISPDITSLYREIAVDDALEMAKSPKV